MLTGWLMPALVFGAGLYIKSRASSGRYRWLAMTEREAKGLPVIAAVGKAESGDALPQAPEGSRWKPITLQYSASPFSAPSEVEIHVLEPVRPGAAVGGLGHAHGDPAAAALARAIRETADSLSERGLALVPIDPSDAWERDFVVLRQGCRLGQIRPGHIGRPMEVDVIHPTRGREAWHPSKAACAFGVRSA